MKVTQCRLCLGQLSDPKLSFPDTPLANEFLAEKIKQDTFPLQVCVCESCGHYQLNEQVDPERMFRHYLFVAGTSPVNVEHFRQYAWDMYKMAMGRVIRRTPKVLDIASNDGTLLQHFKDLGCQVLGIDPAINLAEEATQKGIPTIPDFFTENKANEILKEHGKFDLITANNVFAHVPDMIGFTKGIKKLLSPEGIYTFEVSYFGDVIDKLLFDTIYHEHTSYHTIAPLLKFFASYELEIFKIQKIDTHGGSLRVFVKNGTGRQYYLGDEFLSQEQDIQKSVVRMSKNITLLGYQLREKFNELKSQGKSIAIYGTPAKATTLMYALDIDEKQIDFAVDDAPLKQGRFTPGKHISILHPDAIYERKPDVILVLAWNFAESIIKKHSQFKGKWIISIPELREVNG